MPRSPWQGTPQRLDAPAIYSIRSGRRGPSTSNYRPDSLLDYNEAIRARQTQHWTKWQRRRAVRLAPGVAERRQDAADEAVAAQTEPETGSGTRCDEPDTRGGHWVTGCPECTLGSQERGRGVVEGEETFQR